MSSLCVVVDTGLSAKVDMACRVPAWHPFNGIQRPGECVA